MSSNYSEETFHMYWMGLDAEARKQKLISLPLNLWTEGLEVTDRGTIASAIARELAQIYNSKQLRKETLGALMQNESVL